MRPRKSEVFVDFVRQQPEIVLAAQGGDRLDFSTAEDGAGRVVRTVDPDDSGLWRDRAGKSVEIGAKATFRPQRKGDHACAGRTDDTLISRVDRLADNDLVAGAREALHRAIEAALRAGHDGDIVGGAGLATAPRDPR